MIEQIAHAIIIRDGKYLAVREKKDSYWKLPGGGIEEGETPEQALRRELAEEIGITEISELRKVHEFPLEFERRSFMFYSYLVDTSQDPVSCEEGLKIEWRLLSRMQNITDQAPSQQILHERLTKLGIITT